MVTGLLTGTTPVAIVGLPNFIPHIRSGAVKALAVDSETRSPLFPDVPTLKELGFPNLAPVYFGFVAPAGTPKDVIQKLHEEIIAIGNDPAFRQKRLIDIGIVPVFDTPEQFGAYIKVAARQRQEADRGVRAFSRGSEPLAASAVASLPARGGSARSAGVGRSLRFSLASPHPARFARHPPHSRRRRA